MDLEKVKFEKGEIKDNFNEKIVGGVVIVDIFKFNCKGRIKIIWVRKKDNFCWEKVWF